MAKPKKSPASYSLPSFKKGDYKQVNTQLDKLKTLGFRWVTFTPTYKVTEVKEKVAGSLLNIIPVIGKLLNYLTKTPTKTLHYLKLDHDQTPITELETAVLLAVKKGFNVKIEPHLDWEATLVSTSEKAWRMTMYFSPADPKSMYDGYYEKIISPIIDIVKKAEQIPRPPNSDKPCYALTLGSELDVSLYTYSASWALMKSWCEKRRSDLGLQKPLRLQFGHKLNYDVFLPKGAVRRKMDSVRKNWGLKPLSPKIWPIWELAALGYLRDLDYVSFSFYPPIVGLLPKNFDWTKDTNANSVKDVSEAFQKVAKELRKKLGSKVPMDIGEFGLGSTDLSKPFGDTPEDFIDKSTGTYKKNDDAHSKRRLYIKSMAKFMADNKEWFKSKSDDACCQYLPATFWTVKHYDFLGLWDYPVSVGAIQEDGKRDSVKHKLFVVAQ